MHHQEVCHIVGPASIHQLLELVSASVQSLCTGKYQAQLLGKLFQLGRRISGGCYHDLWILHSRPPVLIILTTCNSSTSSTTLGKCQFRSSIIPSSRLGKFQSISFYIR